MSKKARRGMHIRIRNQETGQPMPEDVLQARAQARLQISELEEQIRALEAELAEERKKEESALAIE